LQAKDSAAPFCQAMLLAELGNVQAKHTKLAHITAQV